MSSDVAFQTEMPSHVNNLELLSKEKGPEDISGSSRDMWLAGGGKQNITVFQAIRRGSLALVCIVSQILRNCDGMVQT